MRIKHGEMLGTLNCTIYLSNVLMTYLTYGNASSIWSDAFALISHTQVMLSCISFRGGFLIAPDELVITLPHEDFSKSRKVF